MLVVVTESSSNKLRLAGRGGQSQACEPPTRQRASRAVRRDKADVFAASCFQDKVFTACLDLFSDLYITRGRPCGTVCERVSRIARLASSDGLARRRARRAICNHVVGARRRYMPSQLQRRLERLLDASVARSINALAGVAVDPDAPPAPNNAELHDLTTKPHTNTRRHWGDATFGTQLHDIQSVTIHETSGWPSYAAADNFRVVYDCTGEYEKVPDNHPTHWYSKRAIGPQYYVEPNGTIFVLIGPENLEGDPQFTWHSFRMSFISLGIEQGDPGDSGVTSASPLFQRLDPHAGAAAADLTGMQLFGLLHPGGAEDLNLMWFAMFPAYTGPGDITRMATRYSNWKNALFTERNYRALALLCRFLAERNGIPRNFPLLPYASVEKDSADASVFRQLLLADALSAQIGATLGVDMVVARAGGAPFATLYAPKHAEWWQRFFGLTLAGGRSTPCFRGFISHMINGEHPCPGPLFEWHRFAREVWDWWWYPFDFDPFSTSSPKDLLTTFRPYRQARGDTPLVEYYFDAAGTDVDYNSLKSLLSVTPADRFTLNANIPIHAMANGVAIAARLPITSNPANAGFLLTRHEVFHTSAAVPAARIDYDQAPTFVWSLIRFVTAPGFSLTQVSNANPDWLNRFVIRLKETELAVAFHTAHAAQVSLTHGWAHQPAAPTPPSALVRRPTTGTTIERDAAAYRPIADKLTAGDAALFPLANDNEVTPVTILLGDYLGTADTLPGGLTVGPLGVQVEIFSNDRLDVPGAAVRAVTAVGESWWNDVSGPTRLEVQATDLPKNGIVWQYAMTDFLRWINGVTWASEWPKYGAVDAANAPVPLPPRPNSRTVL